MYRTPSPKVAKLQVYNLSIGVYHSVVRTDTQIDTAVMQTVLSLWNSAVSIQAVLV